jgi:hypothetical protein
MKLTEKIHKDQLKMDVKRMLMERKDQKEEVGWLRRIFEAFNPRFFARYSSGHIYTGTGGNISGMFQELLGLGGGGGGKSTGGTVKTTGGGRAGKAAAGGGAGKAAAAGGLSAAAATLIGVGVAILLSISFILVKTYKAIKESEGMYFLKSSFQLLIDTIVSMVAIPIIGMFQVLGNLKDLASHLNDRVEDLKDKVLQFVYDMTIGKWLDDLETAWGFITNAGDTIKDAFRDLKDGIPFILKKIGGSILDVLGIDEMEVYLKVTKPIVGGFKSATDWLGGTIETVVGTGKDLISGAGDILGEVDGFVARIQGHVTNLGSTIKEKVDYILELPGKLWNIFNRGLVVPLAGALESLINSVAKGVENVANTLLPGSPVSLGRVNLVDDDQGLVV